MRPFLERSPRRQPHVRACRAMVGQKYCQRISEELRSVVGNIVEQIGVSKPASLLGLLFGRFETNMTGPSRRITYDLHIVAGRIPGDVKWRFAHPIRPENSVLPGSGGEDRIKDRISE